MLHVKSIPTIYIYIYIDFPYDPNKCLLRKGLPNFPSRLPSSWTFQNMEERRNCYQAETESLLCTSSGLRKKRKSNNQRRFSDEQIRLLESMFEAETKPEPVKKAELARELGLQPRQVAIWFQNKRARWKAKQIEQEYRALSASYDALKSKCESLRNERQSLLLQLENLSSLLGKPQDGSRGSEELAFNCTVDGASDNGHAHSSDEVKRDCFLKDDLLENGASICLDDNNVDGAGDMGRIGQLGCDDFQNCNLDDAHMDGFSTSPDEEWGSFDSRGLFSHQDCGSPQWWSFWT